MTLQFDFVCGHGLQIRAIGSKNSQYSRLKRAEFSVPRYNFLHEKRKFNLPKTSVLRKCAVTCWHEFILYLSPNYLSMKLKLTYLFIFISTLLLSQQQNKNQNFDSLISKIQVLDNKTNLEIDRIKNEQQNTAQKIQELKEDFHRELDTYKGEQKERLTQYFIYISLFIGFIGWSFNFFGKRAVKDRVEEIIKSTAQNYATEKVDEILNSTITEEYTARIIREKGEPEINRLLVELETRGMGAISTFQEKGNEVINSVWAARVNVDKPEADIEVKTDAEIKTSQNIERGEEFFNLSLNAKDTKVKIKLLQNAAELQPDNENVLNNLGVANHNAGNYQEAIEYLTKAIEINPHFGLAYSNRASAYNQINQLDNAMTDADKAIEINPFLEAAYATKGNIFTKQSKMVEAEEALTKAIELNPNSSTAYFNRGYFNEENLKYENSLSDYLRAEELLYANKALLYNNIAVSYRRLKKFEMALEYIEKARNINPDLPNIDGTTALIHADLGEDEEFYKFLKVSLEKGCPVWNYLKDSGFDKYRNEDRLSKLIDAYRD